MILNYLGHGWTGQRLVATQDGALGWRERGARGIRSDVGLSNSCQLNGGFRLIGQIHGFFRVIIPLRHDNCREQEPVRDRHDGSAARQWRTHPGH